MRPSDAQRRAIEAPLGPTLVVAGPGAGKTFCLIGRIRHLLDRYELDPRRICAVTFTNRAAEEVRTRMRDDVGQRADAIQGGTLHALCVEILREKGEAMGVARGFGIADEDYQLSVLRRVGVYREGHRRQLLTLFSRRRVQRYELTAKDEAFFVRYRGWLERRGLLDFDDLVLRVHDLFEAFPRAAREVAARWDAVLVDEFQDLDPVQYTVVQTLAAGHRNLFVVGDDEQSIFSWRGADPTVLRRFADDYGVVPVVLDQNRRCSRQIFTVARRLLAVNPSLFDKDIAADRDAPFEVMAHAFDDEDDEAAWLVDDLLADREASGLDWGEYAFLYRRHQLGYALEHRLLQAGVPCRLARGRALQDDEVVGYVVASLRLVSAPDDPVLVETFARRELPPHVVNAVQARAGDESADFGAALRRFAETNPGNDPDTRRAWRFLYHVANLRAARQAHGTLRGLVEELLAHRIQSWENKLERNHEDLSDPADDPAAVRLADRLATVQTGDGTIWIEPLGGLGIALRGLLFNAGFRRVRLPGPHDVLGLADLVIQPGLAGRHGLPITLFKALQLLHTRDLTHAFREYVTFDLETTDRDAATCEIVEIGAARVRDGAIVDQFRSFVRPTLPIHPQATATHGITAADVAEAPAFAEVWNRFRAFVGRDVLVAHNAHEFDLPVLTRMARPLGGSGDELVCFDSLPLARALEPGSRKLEDLADRYGVDKGTAHRALDDALTLARVFPELERRKVLRARKAALVNLLDYLGLALALDQTERPGREAQLLFDLAKTHTLGRYSDSLEYYQAERDRLADGALPPVETVIERLGGQRLMERLRAERSAEELYPQAMGRLVRLVEQSWHEDLDDHIRHFLEQVALSTSQGVEVDRHRVNLLTLHSTKGLEFSRVYVVGVEDYQLPGYYPTVNARQDEIEEGRRLLYVGMTRAKDRLVLTRTVRRGGKDSGGSRYLEEMGLEAVASVSSER